MEVARVQKLHDSAGFSKLSPDDRCTLNLFYDSFKLSGCLKQNSINLRKKLLIWGLEPCWQWVSVSICCTKTMIEKWLDLNRGPLGFEVAVLHTVPIPTSFYMSDGCSKDYFVFEEAEKEHEKTRKNDGVDRKSVKILNKQLWYLNLKLF